MTGIDFSIILSRLQCLQSDQTGVIVGSFTSRNNKALPSIACAPIPFTAGRLNDFLIKLLLAKDILNKPPCLPSAIIKDIDIFALIQLHYRILISPRRFLARVVQSRSKLSKIKILIFSF